MPEGPLEVLDLSKRYGDTVALDGLSFSVAPGQVVGFVGPNGAGKTTTMRIVLGVLEPDAGEVRWQGHPLDAEARRRIGYMPEERGLYPKMRVREHLEYLAELHGMPEERARERARHWVERMGVAERGDDRVEELSLGNQQRVQLGAALVHDPGLLVLDEPFSGLDPVGVDVLSEVLLGEAHDRGVPVVFSSHQLELVERLCDDVVIVSRGTLVAAGEVEALRRRATGNRWRAEGPDGDGWAGGVPGARRLEEGVFELAPGTDPQSLLDAARAAGPVTRFGPDTPTLASLFREAVSEPAPDAGAEPQ